MHSGDMATKDGDDFYYITGEFFAVLGWSGVVVVVVVVLAAAAAAVVVVVVVVVVVPVVVALAVVVVVVPAAAAVVVVPAAADVVSGGGAAAVGGPYPKDSSIKKGLRCICRGREASDFGHFKCARDLRDLKLKLEKNHTQIRNGKLTNFLGTWEKNAYHRNSTSK